MANGYLMVNAMHVHISCINKSLCVNCPSCVGPHTTIVKLISVKLLVVTMPSASSDHWIMRSNLNTRTNNLPSILKSLYRNCVRLHSMRSVSELYLGKRCRGQGTKWKSCGMEYRKLNTCGMKNSRSVLLKWPRMPTTANVIPAR